MSKRPRPDSRPLVSVVIPCYNQGKFLAAAIESVLGQSYDNFEVWVVNDGSADDTEQIVARYPSVNYLRQNNQGLSAARNAGLRASSGEHLVFLDSDDLLLPEAIAAGVECLARNPDCALAFGGFVFLSEDGASQWPYDNSSSLSPGEDIYSLMLRDNLIVMHGTVMYRRQTFAAVGEFDTSLPSSEDYDMYLRISRYLPICWHDRVVAAYRKHNAGMTHDAARMMRSTLKVHRAQWSHARGLRVYELAFRHGDQFWRQFYGEQVVAQARSDFSERQWACAARKLATLWRYSRPVFFEHFQRKLKLTVLGAKPKVD